MTVNEMRERLAVQNFEPFDLVLNSGERLSVRFPEQAVVTRNHTIHLYDLKPGEELPESRFRVVSIHNITLLEPHPVQADNL
jgi:hypothetical protein